ncbi:uncharacterized protein At1g65710 [Vigna radiata var. radiata]|uniref:Uncharacterized protein At1g65710 n=1 Tax=Vigna radiata var. radiata TaxID=3916 RepID=A0A1S3U9H6_VIGRR|nr:uncharacterized protein At1g65710 [Vigna radiata var. radiata]
MGTCLSKKNGSSSSASSKPVSHSENCVSVTEVSLKKKTLQEKQDPESAPQHEGEVRKEVFIIKHRKSHDDRERTTATTASKSLPFIAQSPAPQKGDGASTNEESIVNNMIAPSTPNIGVGVRTSSCTKEEVDAILIQCGRLSRSSSCRKYSGSKRSFDFDNCDNDTTSAEDEQRRAKGSGSEENDVAAESRRHRQSPRRSQGRRRTPSRERDQSSGKERRVSRSPGRRSSDTAANASNKNASSRPGKMVSVPATVSSLAMDKSNNCGGESGTKRVTVKRNVGDVGSRGAASPRAQSPARVNGNVANAKVLSENQQHQQPSLSRNNSSRKAEQSPYRRNPLSEVDTNIKVQQNKPKIEAEVMQKPNGRVALEKGVLVNCKTKEHREEVSSESAVVKTPVVSSGVDNLKPQGLTRSRSSRRSRDLDMNPEAVVNVNATHSYASLLLEDIQNFHQKNTAQQQPQQPQQPSSISLPACLTKACSILEAVADLSYTTSSNISGAFPEDRKSPSTQQSIRNEYYGKKVEGSKGPFVESEVVVGDDVMEPSLHKYVTVKRGGGVVDMDDQESSGSNSFTVSSSGQHHWGGISCSSWEPNSADSTDCWSSRLSSREEGQCNLSSEVKKKKNLNSKRRECDHEHSSGIGRGRIGSEKGVCV